MDLFDPMLAAAAWLPDWLRALLLLAAAAALAMLLHRLAFAGLTRLVAARGPTLRSLVARTKNPLRLAFLVCAVAAVSPFLPVSEAEAGGLQHLLLVCFIALVGWAAIAALYVWSIFHLRRFELDADDNLLARKHVTQLRILRRTANTLIVVVTVSAAMMTFDAVRQYGVSLLASAGAAGLVIGLALQPLLKNLVAGIQLAVTQPIRIDDALLVEGEWGNVEEITATYVVVRIWDWRRLILPLSYFIERPFQNWTRDGSSIIGSVMLYFDYAAPVDRLRRRLEEIVGESPLWDRQVVNLQVTDFRERSMEVRMLMSAISAGQAFDLRCLVREKMIAFLQAECRHALPATRVALAPAGEHAPNRHASGGT